METRNNDSQLRRAANDSLYITLYAVVFFSLAKTVPDTDLWGHLLYGIDFLRAGHILHADPYSYLATGTEWIDHEWLSEIAMGLAYNAGSVLGLNLLKQFFVAGIFGALLWRLLSAKLPPLLIGVEMVVALLLISPGLSPIRPQMFSYLFVALELLVLIEVERTNKARWCLLLVPLFLVWMNAHGGVLAGLGVFAIWLVAYVWKRRPAANQLGLLVASAIGSLLATLATPYGYGLLVFLLKTATVARPEIPEWQALDLLSIRGLTYLLLFAATLFIVWRGMWKKQPASSAVALVCSILPFMAARHLPIAAIALLFLTASELGFMINQRERLANALQFGGKSPVVNKMLIGLCIVASVGLCGYAGRRLQTIRIGSDIPVPAAALLKHSGVHGNIACFFDWGEYLIWHLTPDIKVSIDGRRETTYNERVYKENVDFTYGLEHWDDLLKKEPTDLALLSKQVPAFYLLSNYPGWERVYQDDICGLFARVGSPQSARLKTALKNPYSTRGSYLFP